MSPTARSLRLLRAEGFIACVVEKWIPATRRRSDAFGFGDILAASPSIRAIVLVQATSAGNVSARLTKARAIPELGQWLNSGGRFEVHGWAKKGNRWHVRRIEVKAEELAPVEILALPRAKRRRNTAPGLFDGLAG